MNKLVPTLKNCQDLAKTAKEHGVDLPETYFWWTTDNVNFKWDNPNVTWWVEPTDATFDRRIPAPTAGELGEWLPWSLDIGCVNYDKWPNCHRVTYYLAGEHHLEKTAPTEQDARCLCLIHLIAEGLITKI